MVSDGQLAETPQTAPPPRQQAEPVLILAQMEQGRRPVAEWALDRLRRDGEEAQWIGDREERPVAEGQRNRLGAASLGDGGVVDRGAVHVLTAMLRVVMTSTPGRLKDSLSARAI